MKKTSYTTLLKNKTFMKVWVSQLISLTTAYMLNFILVDRIYTATNSTIAVALFWGFHILPSATLGPFVGVFIDYLSKKKIFVISSFFQALIVLLYLGVGQKIWPLYTIVLLYSFCDEFFNPAVGAFLPAIVKKKELPIANSLFLFTTQSSVVFGFLIGGLVLKLSPFVWLPFALAFILLLMAAWLTGSIPQDKPALVRKPQAGLKDFWQDLIEGYQFMRRESRVLFPILLLVGLQVIGGIGMILLPSISQDHLGIRFSDSAFMIIIPGILGGIIGVLMAERLLKKYLKRFLIIFGLYAMGLTTLLLATVPWLFRSPGYFSPLFSLVLGLATVAIFMPLKTLVQENTPFDIRGRVFGTLSMLVTLAAAIPVLIATTLVDILGIASVLFIMGAGLVLLASYSARGKYGIIPNNHRS